MKIKYDLTNNYFKLFDAAQGITTFKKDILKDPYKEALSYTEKWKHYGKLTVFEFLLTLVFRFISPTFFITKILLFLFAVLLGLLTIFIVLFLSSYIDARKKKCSGEVLINKNGILDTNDDGIKIGIPWKYVDFILYKEDIICIVSKLSFIFFFDNSCKDKVLEAIMKYAPDSKIINQSHKKISQVEEKKEEPKKETAAKEESNEETNEKIEKEENKEAEKETEKKKEETAEEEDTEVEDAIKELTEK